MALELDFVSARTNKRHHHHHLVLRMQNPCRRQAIITLGANATTCRRQAILILACTCTNEILFAS